MIFQKDLPKEEKQNPLADKVVDQIEKSIDKNKK
jgi:hypothetical protein